MNFDLHFGSHFIDFDKKKSSGFHFFTLRAPRARAGDDPPQAPSIDRFAGPPGLRRVLDPSPNSTPSVLRGL